jgi:hypothetical protein
MDKLIDLHLPHSRFWDCYNDEPLEEDHALKSAEITANVAVEFGKFLLWYTPVGDDYGNLILWKNVHTEEVKLTEQLFEEFINNHYGK